MKLLRYTPQFKKEITKFSEEVKEDIFLLVKRYLEGERLPKTQFKTFSVNRIKELKNA